MAYVVDLRSDTFTKPTEAMKLAMVNSPLGDDVYGEDPTMKALEKKLAALLDKEAAMFVPSGTMGNLIAIMVHCNKRGSEVFTGDKSHIYKYEQGGASHLGGVLISTLENKPDGTFDLKELERRLRGSDIHEPLPSLVTVENTQNYCGGKVLPLKFLDDLAAFCKKRSLPLHMDGARLFNAAAASQDTPARIVRDFDTVSLCFSKGLSAPVGSALVGSRKFIEEARRIRMMLGGAMRQAGVLAAAAIVALDEVVPLLPFDHKRTKILARAIHELSLKTFLVDVEGVQSNMILLKICEDSDLHSNQVLQRLAQVEQVEIQGNCKTPNNEGIIVKAKNLNSKTVRLTFHREISDEDLRLAIMKISFVLKELEGSEQISA